MDAADMLKSLEGSLGMCWLRLN